jgi:hypothetical protein
MVAKRNIHLAVKINEKLKLGMVIDDKHTYIFYMK